MASGSRKVIYAALIGNGLISVTKLAAATITGSSAMLSEGIHSIVDTGNQVLLLIGLKRSQRPPDPAHPLGYGKEVYFWSFIVAILIFAVGAGVSLYEGVRHILHPNHLGDVRLNYLVLALAFVFEGVAWYFALKEFRQVKGRRGYMQAVKRSKDPTTFVVLFEDSAAMAGIIVAFLGIWLGQVTGLHWLDGAASVVIGLILGLTAWILAVETKGLLIGEGAPPEVVKSIRGRADAMPGVVKVNEVLTLHMGPEDLLVNLSLDFKDDLTAEQVEAEIASLSVKIREDWPQVKRIFTKAEENRATH